MRCAPPPVGAAGGGAPPARPPPSSCALPACRRRPVFATHRLCRCAACRGCGLLRLPACPAAPVLCVPCVVLSLAFPCTLPSCCVRRARRCCRDALYSCGRCCPWYRLCACGTLPASCVLYRALWHSASACLVFCRWRLPCLSCLCCLGSDVGPWTGRGPCVPHGVLLSLAHHGSWGERRPRGVVRRRRWRVFIIFI